METIEEWIIEDILQSIRQLGFSIEEGPLPYLHATTNCKTKLVIYNRQTVTLFELTEELMHAKYKHKRHQKEYDVRNPNESDAHHLALQFLLNRWKYYDGSKNWLTFLTVTGTPNDFEDEIIDFFSANKISNSLSLGSI